MEILLKLANGICCGITWSPTHGANFIYAMTDPTVLFMKEDCSALMDTTQHAWYVNVRQTANPTQHQQCVCTESAEPSSQADWRLVSIALACVVSRPMCDHYQ
eukprot:scaffold154831_cov18-Prasinocladus_malaysianus.AAC.1